MHYFDTNILIYSLINQDEDKMLKSQELLRESIKNDHLLISPLTLQEMIFTIAKLKTPKEVIFNSYQFFKKYSKYQIDNTLIQEAFDLCNALNKCQNINDAIHIKFAEKHCTQIFTFDKDFNRFENSLTIKVIILK